MASMLISIAGGLTATASFSCGPVFGSVGRATSSLDLPLAENVLLPPVSDFVEAVRAERLPACRDVLMDAVNRTAREGPEVAIDGGAES